MLTQEQKTILGKLGYYISFLALALPSRSVPTFCELLVASMITTEGFVTQSWLQGRLHNFWGSYHKWLETGHWRSYQVIARFMQLCCLTIPETQPLFLVIDDTLVLRFSEKAPGWLGRLLKQAIPANYLQPRRCYDLPMRSLASGSLMCFWIPGL